MVQAVRTLSVLAVVMLASGTAAADSGRASDRAGQRVEPSPAAREAQRAAQRDRIARPLKVWTAAQLAAEIKRIMDSTDKQKREAEARDTKRPR